MESDKAEAEVRSDQLQLKAVEMLNAAAAVLTGDTDIPARRRTRAAALLARTALELAVDAHLTAAGLEIMQAGTRVKLICLRATSPEVSDDAAIAWAGLSRGCHQHAYELAPVHSEISHFAQLVAQLVRAPGPPPTSPAVTSSLQPVTTIRSEIVPKGLE